MNEQWLIHISDLPIRHNLGEKVVDFTEWMKNEEVSYWYSRLKERCDAKELGDIHGSHDYRMENILGKCAILGLSKEQEPVSDCMEFIIDFLHQHITQPKSEELTIGKNYQYRDYEKVLSCYLPFMGYGEDEAVQYITKQRIEKLYSFTKERRYDIYDRDGKYSGVTKAWLPYMIQPSLYADGQIALPDMHDMILFAGTYPYLTEAEQEKVETIVAWLFGDGYSDIIRRYGYFYFPNDAYHAKAIIFKLHLMDMKLAKDGIAEKSDLGELIFQVFILAHFKTARKSLWFQLAMDYLETFRCENAHYKFPATMLQEKTDCFVMKGGHMNVGENKRKKEYREIISTYWMNRIIQLIDKD